MQIIVRVINFNWCQIQTPDTAAQTQTEALSLHGIGLAAICCKLESRCHTIVITKNNHTTPDRQLGSLFITQTQTRGWCSLRVSDIVFHGNRLDVCEMAG